MGDQGKTGPKVDVIRAWTDPEYRSTLSPEELASLPEKVGISELSDQDLDNASGGQVTPLGPRKHPDY
jgi:mersacidin/lichenicidin family type 2 lantibiotic